MQGTTLLFVKQLGPDLVLTVNDALDWTLLAYFRPADTSGLSVGASLDCFLQTSASSDVWLLGQFTAVMT
jgi:hypothetical protein